MPRALRNARRIPTPSTSSACSSSRRTGIEAHFAQDLRSEPSRLRYQNQPPDRDVFTVRASLGLTMREGWSAFATADVLLGHAYRHRYGVALGVRKQLQ